MATPARPGQVAERVSGVRAVLTISRLKARSMAYYNDTSRAAMNAAADRQKAGGGLGEYYSEAETRAPVWMLAGDTGKAAALTGLSASDRAGGVADLDVVEHWIVDGSAPNRATGRAFGERSNHGFDLVFCAPKSVSLARAVGGDEVLSKAIAEAHRVAVAEALEYLHSHAGYTRVHNPITGMKDLVRLPGLVTAAYQHETSRAGDPHLHTHVLLPNRQARADGEMVSVDSKSLHHEAKAAGIVYQASLRHELHQSMGLEWEPVDPHTGQADIAGIDPETIRAWSQRATQLRQWAAANLVCDDPNAPTPAQLATAQKATRPRKPEHLSWAELQQSWAADERGFSISEAGQAAARHARRTTPGNVLTAARAAAAGIDKPAFTRADLIEAIGARLPVAVDGAPDGPRILMEVLADRMAMPLTAPRAAHEREGHDRFTTAPIVGEEAAIVSLIGSRDAAAALPANAVQTEELSPEQARAITAIATSPWLAQPLSAPAGAGKTTSLRALRAAVQRSPRHDRVVVLAPTGKAVDVAVREHAGDTGLTIAAALERLRNGTLKFDKRTVVVVDEAGMVGSSELRELLSATTAAGTKTVLVGDAHQLAPVKSRGGMFDQLCGDLPWTQHLTEVWRMNDVGERTASLGVRHGGAAARRRAVDWYRRHDRLATGDTVTMAADALAAYTRDREAGKDALLVADSWEMCDALNTRIHRHTIPDDAPTVAASRGHRIAVGDVVISRRNDPDIPVYDAHDLAKTADPVRNGHRWRIIGVDPDTSRVAARRLGDGARVVFEGDYLSTHVHLGYAVTVHAAQGATADTAHTLLSDTAHKALAYVGLTRGREANRAYLYTKDAGEADHAHAEPTPGVHMERRGTAREAAALLTHIVGRDTRAHTAAVAAADTDRALLPEPVQDLLEHRDRTRAACRTAHRHHLADRALAAELPLLHAEVTQIEHSWEHSPATVYPPPATGRETLDDPTRAAVTTITASMQNVQILTVGADADKHATLAAVTAAVHGQNKPVLAVQTTAQAIAEAKDRPYADRSVDPRRIRDRIDKGELTIPPGTLLIIDDADQLNPKLLRYFTEHATATNTKLLLVRSLTAERQPRHTVVDALADDVPWTQHIGTQPPPQAHRTATERVTTLLAEPHTGAPSRATSAAAELLDRRTRVLDAYQQKQAQAQRWSARHAQRERGRDRGGLEL
ncbi:MobF family relaxase [Mycobacterium sp. URHB0021]